MRAIEVIENYRDKIKYFDEIKRIVDVFTPLRLNGKATQLSYENLLISDIRYEKLKKVEKTVFVYNNGEIEREIAAEFREQLYEVLRWDNSFKYLRIELGFDTDHVDIHCKDPDYYKQVEMEVKATIQAQKEDYPKEDLDDCLNDSFNYNFYQYYSPDGLTNEEWLVFFNTAYFLFSDIRIKMVKPLQAIDYIKSRYKESTMPDKIKIRILEFVGYLLEEYDFNLPQLEQCKRVCGGLAAFLDTFRIGETDIEKNDWRRRTSDYDKDSITNLIDEYSNNDKGKILRLIAAQCRKDTEKADKLLLRSPLWNCGAVIDLCRKLENELNKDSSMNMEDEITKLKEDLKDAHAEIERLKSKINSVEENDNEEEPFKGKGGTMKVQTAVLLKILNKLGINENTADFTKIAKFISYLTSKSAEKIRQAKTDKYALTNTHTTEIKHVNKLLSEINIDITIEKGEQL
jgi:hypothetical protein